MITKDQLQYLGAVRTPGGKFAYVKPASVDFVRREYIMSDISNKVGRLKMVRPTLPRNNAAMPDRRALDRTSVPLAPFVDSDVLIDPSNNTWYEMGPTDDPNNRDAHLQEVLVLGNKALVAGNIFYDASGAQDVSWFVADWPLTQPVVRTPWRTVANVGEGWASGPATIIPERFRAALKGDVLFGQPGGLPIISRQSFGPCAISAYANDFLTKSDVPANLLLGYNNGDLAFWGQDPNNDYWNAATYYTSLVFMGDYLVFIGTHGYGDVCYGAGLRYYEAKPEDIALHETTRSDGAHVCFDPLSETKGTHAYPYRVQGAVYAVADLAAVAAGAKKFNAVKPVGWFPIELPWFDSEYYPPLPTWMIPSFDVRGADFDNELGELHVIVSRQDSLGWDQGPLVHVFKVDGIPTGPNPVLQLGDIDEPLPPPPPTPDLEPEPEPTLDYLKAIVAALQAEKNALMAELSIAKANLETTSAALATTTATRDAVLTRLAAIKVTVKAILDYNATLKPNSRLPKSWVIEPLNQILTK